MRSVPRIVGTVLVACAVGCGGHRSSFGSASTAGGSTGSGGGSPTPATAVLTVEAHPLASAVQAVAPGPIAVLGVKFAATGGDVDISRIDVVASGSIDETAFGEARLVLDADRDGAVGPADSLVATGLAPQVNDGSYSIQPVLPIRIDAGTAVEFLIAVDSSPLGTSADHVKQAGKTAALTLDDALAVLAADPAGNVISVNGTFPLGNSVTLSAGEHVLISEVATAYGVNHWLGEYVELVNPTAAAIDLSDYYLTDFTADPTAGQFHWKLPTGVDFGPANTSNHPDFIVRFPAGATIAPGQVIVVAVDGAGFAAESGGLEADYCLRNPGTTAAAQMLSWNGVPGAAFTAAPTTGGLTGSLTSASTATGELVCLFAWDGVSDLIQDVDLVNYGSSSATNVPVDKSPGQTAPGAPDVRVDSITDADRVESTYQPDTDFLGQEDRRAPCGPSVARIDFSEGAETASGGNGVAGHDETSEGFGDGLGGNGTFVRSTTHTPGTLD